jgi:hypothetical protein
MLDYQEGGGVEDLGLLAIDHVVANDYGSWRAVPTSSFGWRVGELQ